jgi:hypothetical protein
MTIYYSAVGSKTESLLLGDSAVVARAVERVEPRIESVGVGAPPQAQVSASRPIPRCTARL